MTAEWANVLVGAISSLATVGAVFIAIKSRYSKPKIKSRAVLQEIDEEEQLDIIDMKTPLGEAMELHFYLWNESSGQAMVKEWGYILDGISTVVSRESHTIKEYGVLDLKYREFISVHFEEEKSALDVRGQHAFKRMKRIKNADKITLFCEFQNHKRIEETISEDNQESYTRVYDLPLLDVK